MTPEERSAQDRKYASKVPKEVLAARVKSSMHKRACREAGVDTYEEVLALRAQARADRKADDLAMQAFWKEQDRALLAGIFERLDRAMAPIFAEDDRKKRQAERRRYRERTKRERPEVWSAMVRRDRQNRRARERNAKGSFSTADIQRLWTGQQGKCYYCGTALQQTGGHTERYHIDHLVPLALGGTNYPSNLVLACPPCNSEKSGIPPEEYLSSIGRLL